MSKLKIKNLIFIGLVLTFLFGASLVSAQEINYPNLPGVQEPQDFLKVAEEGEALGLWLSYIIALLTWFAGLLAFLFLIVGGIKYIISSGSPDKLTDAKKQITNAFLGLTIILSSYIILGILSPNFVSFSLPSLENLEKSPDFPNAPEKSELISSVDVYLPVGRLIETIFETYFSYVPTKDNPIAEDAIPRLQRIENILDATSPILPEILIRTDLIKDLSRKCSCQKYTDPDPECKPTGCGSCNPKGCTGDPCESVRGDIVHEENDLLPFFFGDVVIAIQHDAHEEEFEIKTNLTKEIDKLETEIRLLKDLFGKLSRTQEIINSCSLLSVNNFNRFGSKKDKFDANDWFIDAVNFFDDIDITYNQPVDPFNVQERWFPGPDAEMEPMTDRSTLYCAVGGNNVRQPTEFENDLGWIEERLEELADVPEGIEDISEEDFEDLFHYELACDITIPFGEVIDKTHRTTRLLINRLEFILKREKKILEATEQLQVLISQCSSKLCFPICICVRSGAGADYCIEVGCLGPACLDSQIDKEFRDIRRYIEEIQDAINGVKPYDKPKTISMDLIINKVAPDILMGMDELLRFRLSRCGYERDGKDGGVTLSRCEDASGAIDQIGLTIRSCQPGTNEEWQDTFYGNCLNRCFLRNLTEVGEGYGQNYAQEMIETGNLFTISDYRTCIRDCLGAICVYKIRHKFNFHCCYVKQN